MKLQINKENKETTIFFFFLSIGENNFLLGSRNSAECRGVSLEFSDLPPPPKLQGSVCSGTLESWNSWDSRHSTQ